MATIKAPFTTRVLRNYSRWALAQEQSIRRLQRWWRSTKRLQPQNTVDYITLEPVGCPVFRHVSDTGHVTAFTAGPLAEYLVSSGNFTHPETRVPFLSVELLRLDHLTKRQFNLHINQHHIEAESKDSRATQQLEDFFVSEVRALIQRCVDQCFEDTTQDAWFVYVRGFIPELASMLTSLRLVNPFAVENVMDEVILSVEERFFGFDSLNMPFPTHQKLLVLLIYLKTIQTDLA